MIRELLLLILIRRDFYCKSYGQFKAYQEAIPRVFIWFTNGISNSVYEFKYEYRKFFVVLMEISASIACPFLQTGIVLIRRTIHTSLTCRLLENSKS